MSDKTYTVDLFLGLRCQWTKTTPEINLRFNEFVIYQGPLTCTREFSYSSPPLFRGTHRISLQFSNKDDSELAVYGRDMMVGVDYIRFENQPNDFSFCAKYQPDYPAHWYQDNLDQGRIPDPVIESNYMGWNGCWFIDIELPIFRWIHKVTDQGWLI